MNQLAQTILAQLGGNTFVRMTGARNFVHSATSLSFRLPWPKVNVVHITLDPDDTYHCVFSFHRGDSRKVKADHFGVYAEDLAALFRFVTGLETRRPTVRFA